MKTLVITANSSDGYTMRRWNIIKRKRKYFLCHNDGSVGNCAYTAEEVKRAIFKNLEADLKNLLDSSV